MTGTAHQPERPSWLCQECRQPWPCPPEKSRLLRQHERDLQALTVGLATYYFDAAMELLTTSPEALYERFVAWSRPSSPAGDRPAAAPVESRPATPHRRQPARARAVG